MDTSTLANARGSCLFDTQDEATPYRLVSGPPGAVQENPQETLVEADFNRPSSRRTTSWVLGFENGDGAMLLYGKPFEPLAQNLSECGDRVFLV